MQGLYHDPLHGHCLRRIVRTSPMTYRIVGVYGSDEPHTHRVWSASMRVIDQSADAGIRLAVDFSGKPTKTNRLMTAVYKNRTLRWVEDGNVWHQLFVHSSQL